MSNLEQLVTRLEACVAKLEGKVGQAAPVPAADQADITAQINDCIGEFQPAFLEESKKLGADVVKTAEVMIAGMQCFAAYLGLPFQYKKMTDAQICEFVKPMMKRLPPPPRGTHQDNACKAMEAALDLDQFLLQPAPIEYLKEQIGTVEYYNNRVRQDQDIASGKQWA